MEDWVWVLIGFTAGLVVFAIFRLIFHKDNTAEYERAADEQGAQLSKAEMKSAVLQDKLLEAESAHRSADEVAKISANLGEEQRSRMAEECQSKLDAAEAGYRENLAVLEKQFADLEAALAAQAAAKEEEDMQAAELAAVMAAADVIAEHDAMSDPDADDYDLEEAQQWAALAGVDPDEDEDAVEEESEAAAAEVVAAAGEADGSDDVPDDTETAVEEMDDDEEGAGFAAKAAMAVGGAAVAAAVLSDEPDDEQEELDVAADTEGDEESSVDGEADEALEEAAVPEEEAGDLPEDSEEVEPEAEEDDEEGNAAAVAAALAGGTAAAALAAAGEDEEETAETAEEQIEEIADPEDVVRSAENLGDGVDEELVDEQESDIVPKTSAEVPKTSAEGAIFAAGAAALGAAVADEAGEEPSADAEEAQETAVEEAEPVEPPWPEDRSTWQGEYFNNMKLEGDPVLAREDAEIDFDWGMGSPAPEVNVDGFSVRWTRTADLPPGLYRFTVTSDDGARLWVNERMVVSAWYDHTEMTFRREMELPGGPVDLRVEYYENVMAALIRVSWERIG